MEDHAISVILFTITVDAPTPQVEARYVARTKRVYALNRALFQAYFEFLTPLGTRPDTSPTTTPIEQPHISSSRGTSSAREVSAAVRQRVHEQQHQESSSSSDPGQPARRLSTRAQPPKRIRYDPQAMGQGPKDASRFSTTTPTLSKTQHLIVDTGASHVLFRQEDSHCLAHVQFSPPCSSPFAILSAANGASLNAIGRGMFTVGTVTIVAFIF